MIGEAAEVGSGQGGRVLVGKDVKAEVGMRVYSHGRSSQIQVQNDKRSVTKRQLSSHFN
jgi:hypothetical protein